MPYNQHAESFATGERFIKVYSDIADATPTEGEWRLVPIINTLPSLATYAPKSRAEIVRVVVRAMQQLPAEAHGLMRVRIGVYQWRFGEVQP